MNDAAMLQAIFAAPIVSTDTLRADHLCSALVAEADRLEITLERDLWQPAVAIAAHGLRGIVLDLPPRLQEISGDIVSDLFDALNCAAPDGCSLGSAEGDGACFVWSLTLGAQAEAINAEPKGQFEAKTLEIPSYWLSALANGDCSGLEDGDVAQLDAFEQEELSGGWSVTDWEDESGFCTYHDARPYGVPPCDTVTVLAMRQKPAASPA